MADSVDKIRSKRFGRLSTAAITTALAVGGLAAMTGTANAAPGDVSPVTQYGTYAPTLPEGCDASTALQGLLFDNGRETPNADLRQLTLQEGDTLRMTWTAFAPGCEDVVVSLVSYRTIQVDPEIQELRDGWQHVHGAQSGPYSLEVQVPGDPYACFRQVDAVFGPPLARVGFPSSEWGNPTTGSFYNDQLRGNGGENMLISAWDSAPVAEVCEIVTPPSTPPTTTPPTTTPTSTVQIEQTVPTPTPETEVAPAAPVAPTQVLGITATRLPATGAGSTTPWLAGMSVLLLAVGTVLAGQGRRLARRSA